jgi:hypothetical protein
VSVSGSQRDCGRAVVFLVSISGRQKNRRRAVTLLCLYQDRRVIVGAQWYF